MASKPDSPIRHITYRRAYKYWREEARRRTLTCGRCGLPINTQGPRGPFSLDIGHIVGIVSAIEMGWRVEEINALTNTRPEHSRCNQAAGARAGHSRRSRPDRPARTVQSGVW